MSMELHLQLIAAKCPPELAGAVSAQMDVLQSQLTEARRLLAEASARLAAAESERDRIKSLIANAPTVLTKYQIGDAIYDSPPMSRNLVKLELIARPNLEPKP